MTKNNRQIQLRIITLSPGAEHVSRLTSQLENLGFTVKIFHAVDGRNSMPALLGNETLSPVDTLIRHYRLLSTAEIGCYLSHYRCIQDAWETGLERVCILEDDIGIEKDFKNVLEAISQLPNQFEFIRLMALRLRRRKIIHQLTSDPCHSIISPLRGLVGTQGYVINRQGMEKFIRKANIIRDPIDIFFDNFWDHGIRVYGIEPHVIFEHEHESSIDNKKIIRPHLPLSFYIYSRLKRLSSKAFRILHIARHFYDYYPNKMQDDEVSRKIRLR